MFIWLLACTVQPEACDPGLTRGEDGDCHTEDAATDTAPDDTDTEDTGAPASIEDVLDALPACEPASDDGRLDLDAGCADGICSYMTYEEIVAGTGDEGDCDSYYYRSGSYEFGGVSCAFDGVSVSFDDEDVDGIPDEGSYTYGVSVDAPFDGGTVDGLGIDASMSCFVEALGYPDSVSFAVSGRDWGIRSASWSDHGVYAYDYYDARGNYEPDTYVDGISTYGSSAEY